MDKITRLIPSEHQSQATVIQWARANIHKYPDLCMLHATPNQGKRSYGAARYFKDEGLSKGFPDLSLHSPRGIYHGLFIEMKRKGGKATEEQRDWLKRLSQRSYAVSICFDADEAIQTIEWYLRITAPLERNFFRGLF